MSWGRWAFGLVLYVYSYALHVQLVEAVHGMGYGDWRDVVAGPFTYVLVFLQALGMAITLNEGLKSWAELFRMFR